MTLITRGPNMYFQKSSLRLPAGNNVQAGAYGAELFSIPPYNPIAPQMALITILPNFTDLMNLNLNASGGFVDFFFKLEQVEYGDSGAPDGEGSAEEATDGNYWPLPYTGLRLVVPFYGLNITVGASGSSGGEDWEGKSVGFKTQVTPLQSAGLHNNPLPVVVTGSKFLPRYAKTLKLDSPNAGASTFQFIRPNESVIQTYPTGVEVAVPTDAYRIAVLTPLRGLFSLY